jgi:hypothetical protein
VKNDPAYNPDDFKQTAKGLSNYINLNLLDKSKLIILYRRFETRERQQEYSNQSLG